MNVKELLSQLTLEEKAALLQGKTMWTTWDIPRVGLPSIFLSDGPHGLRKQAGPADNLGLNLSDDVCNYIAINITNNVRQIEGTVKKILAYRDLNNMPLDLPNISRAIDDMFKSEGNALPTPSLIISQVCKFYSIDEVVLRSTQRNRGVAEARQIAMYLIRKLTNLSLPDIGKEFARDHSTALYGIRKVEVGLKNGDTTLQNNIRDITANINSCL